VASFIVKTKAGNRVLGFAAVSSINAGVWAKTDAAEWPGENGPKACSCWSAISSINR